MEFCTKCDNMLYIQINEDNTDSIVYYCRTCGHEQSMEDSQLCVSKINLKRTVQKYEHSINKYTTMDPTLPRLYHLKCPNDECTTKHPEVVYLRYDDEQLKYVYICKSCNTVWKSNSK